MINIIIAVGIFWLLCGFTAYGILKNDWKCFYAKFEYAAGYDAQNEDLLRVEFLSGVFGLIEALLRIVSEKNGRIGFCFKMPLELTSNYRQRNEVKYFQAVRGKDFKYLVT